MLSIGTSDLTSILNPTNQSAIQLSQGANASGAGCLITKPLWREPTNPLLSSPQSFGLAQIGSAVQEIGGVVSGLKDMVTALSTRIGGMIPSLSGELAAGGALGTNGALPTGSTQTTQGNDTINTIFSKLNETFSGVKDFFSNFTSLGDSKSANGSKSTNILKSVASLIGSFVGFSPTKSTQLFKSFQDVFKQFSQK